MSIAHVTSLFFFDQPVTKHVDSSTIFGWDGYKIRCTGVVGRKKSSRLRLYDTTARNCDCMHAFACRVARDERK